MWILTIERDLIFFLYVKSENETGLSYTVSRVGDFIRSLYRSSRPEVFSKKGVFRNFAKFTEKHLCQSLFLNKVADLWTATLLKKRHWLRCFPVNFVKFLRNLFHRTPLVAASFYISIYEWIRKVWAIIRIFPNSQAVTGDIL